MYLLRRRGRQRSFREPGRVQEVRLESAGAGETAAVRRDVFDEVLAGRRWRNHCGDLQGACAEARLRLGRLGLDDGLSPRNCAVTCRWGLAGGHSVLVLLMALIVLVCAI